MYMLLFVIKYIDYGAILKMGIVIAILEENKHGDVALGVSAYLYQRRQQEPWVSHNA